MSNMSDYLEVELRKHIFRTGSFTKPAALYVGLSTATITDATTGTTVTEPSGGYSRQQLDPGDSNWTGASSTDGLTDNASAITFGPASGSWGTVTDFFIADAASNGNILVYGTLTASKSVASGDSVSFGIGDLNITFA